MKYAVIAVSGTQFKVEENQTITVDKIDLKDGEKGTVNEVLLLVDGDKVTVGSPNIKGASVDFTISKSYKGDKLRVFKFKSKSRYRRTSGFRSQLTDITITKINN